MVRRSLSRAILCLLAMAATLTAVAEPVAAGTVTLEAGLLRYRALPGESRHVRILLQDASPPTDVIVSEFAAAPPIIPGEIGTPGVDQAVPEQPAAGAGCTVGTAPAEGWTNYSELPVVRCALAAGAPLPRLRAELGRAAFTYLFATRPLRGDVFGSPGDDDIDAAGRLHGGAGDDTLHGGRGRDIVYPGPGRDTVWLTGRTGRGDGDVVRARERELDEIHCDPSDRSDRLLLDGRDWVEWKLPMIGGREEGRLALCPGVARSGKTRRAFPLDAFYDDEDFDTHPDANMLVQVGCPSDGPAICTGIVSISQQQRRLARKGFRVRAEHARLVGLQAVCRCPRDDFSFIARVAVRTRAGRRLLPGVVKRVWVIDPFEDN